MDLPPRVCVGREALRRKDRVSFKHAMIESAYESGRRERLTIKTLNSLSALVARSRQSIRAFRALRMQRRQALTVLPRHGTD